MTKILVYARGAVGSSMGSTGIRCYHTARVLAEQLPDAEVTLGVPNDPDIPSPHPRLRFVHYRNGWEGLRLMLANDVIISRNFSPAAALLFASRRKLLLDFYAPFFVEWMPLASRRIPDRARRKVWAAANRHYLNYQLTLADAVFCSNERQRDAWIGLLAALGLVTPGVYDRDRTLRGLVDVVPYGIQPGRPERERPTIKGVVPGIRETDKVLIWNGSIMEWFDAETVIRAMAEVSRVRDDVKLFFLGTDHPDLVAILRPGDRPYDAMELSKQLGLYERSVFFNAGWVPYEEIGGYLADADIGVCAGYDNVEARYAFRTRLVDLFWAELPVVCSRGDVLAERVERDGLGLVVEPGDASGFAAAILRLLDDEALYQSARCNMPAVKADLSWERVLEPLVERCRSG
ncbi:MAG: glycosyltransferase, partial [Dehalococcoidia bacterium]